MLSYRFFVIAALAVLTNGMSLLGLAEQSAGAVARSLECKSAITRTSEILRSGTLSGEPLSLHRKIPTASARPRKSSATVCETVAPSSMTAPLEGAGRRMPRSVTTLEEIPWLISQTPPRKKSPARSRW